jgi:hypothetical protein
MTDKSPTKKVYLLDIGGKQVKVGSDFESFFPIKEIESAQNTTFCEFPLFLDRDAELFLEVYDASKLMHPSPLSRGGEAERNYLEKNSILTQFTGKQVTLEGRDRKFVTTLQTLERSPYFHKCIHTFGDTVDGMFIDHNPEHFKEVLRVLRNPLYQPPKETYELLAFFLVEPYYSQHSWAKAVVPEKVKNQNLLSLFSVSATGCLFSSPQISHNVISCRRPTYTTKGCLIYPLEWKPCFTHEVAREADLYNQIFLRILAPSLTFEQLCRKLRKVEIKMDGSGTVLNTLTGALIYHLTQLLPETFLEDQDAPVKLIPLYYFGFFHKGQVPFRVLATQSDRMCITFEADPDFEPIEASLYLKTVNAFSSERSGMAASRRTSDFIRDFYLPIVFEKPEKTEAGTYLYVKDMREFSRCSLTEIFFYFCRTDVPLSATTEEFLIEARLVRLHEEDGKEKRTVIYTLDPTINHLERRTRALKYSECKSYSFYFCYWDRWKTYEPERVLDITDAPLKLEIEVHPFEGTVEGWAMATDMFYYKDGYLRISDPIELQRSAWDFLL